MEKPQLNDDERRSGEESERRFLVEWRGVFSLYFAKFFFVVLVGKDTRTATQELTRKRIRKARLLGNLTFFLVVGLPWLLLLAIGLYFVKQMLGIDIFPGLHMPSVIKGWFT